jgi:hypothetical protein
VQINGKNFYKLDNMRAVLDKGRLFVKLESGEESYVDQNLHICLFRMRWADVTDEDQLREVKFPDDIKIGLKGRTATFMKKSPAPKGLESEEESDRDTVTQLVVLPASGQSESSDESSPEAQSVSMSQEHLF